MTDAFNSAASTHQAVTLAAHLGSKKVNESILNVNAAPLKAISTSLSGSGSSKDLRGALADVTGKNTKTGDGKIPNLTDPVIAVAAQNGFSASAGQSVQLANGEATVVISTQDTQLVGGSQARLQSLQAIGILCGVIKSGQAGIGLQFIATKDAIDIQSQADELRANAKNELSVVSANAFIDWAATKKLSLTTAGGAHITIESGNIAVHCPGKLLVRAGKKCFAGPKKLSYKFPWLPVANLPDRFSNRLDVHDLFVLHSFEAINFAARLPGDKVIAGTLDKHGRSTQIYAKEDATVEILSGVSLEEWDLIVDNLNQ